MHIIKTFGIVYTFVFLWNFISNSSSTLSDPENSCNKMSWNMIYLHWFSLSSGMYSEQSFTVHKSKVLHWSAALNLDKQNTSTFNPKTLFTPDFEMTHNQQSGPTFTQTFNFTAQIQADIRLCLHFLRQKKCTQFTHNFWLQCLFLCIVTKSFLLLSLWMSKQKVAPKK